MFITFQFLYIWHLTSNIDIMNGRGLSNKVGHELLPKETKVMVYLLIRHIYRLLQHINVNWYVSLIVWGNEYIVKGLQEGSVSVYSNNFYFKYVLLIKVMNNVESEYHFCLYSIIFLFRHQMKVTVHLRKRRSLPLRL